jgi:Leucine-rich repeat (LRR) protein
MHQLLFLIPSLIGQPPMEVIIRPLREVHPERVQLWKQLPPEQRIAAEQIEALGGGVMMNHVTGKPPAELVIFRGDRFTDTELRLLLPFRGTELYGLALTQAKITDAALARSLEDFPKLRHIGVTDMAIGDKALTPLERLNDLEDIVLSRTNVTSAVLPLIGRQHGLTSLDIADTKVNDVGFKYLEGLSKLTRLSAGRAKFTSVALASIGKLTNLESLTLHETQIDDDGLVHLSSLQSLQSLRIDGTNITNAGMVHVAKLNALRDLDVERTKVDEKGLALLQNMPNLREVRWVDEEKATPEQKRFLARFLLYLPANANRWKDAREKFERGELKFE